MSYIDFDENIDLTTIKLLLKIILTIKNSLINLLIKTFQKFLC